MTTRKWGSCSTLWTQPGFVLSGRAFVSEISRSSCIKVTWHLRNGFDNWNESWQKCTFAVRFVRAWVRKTKSLVGLPSWFRPVCNDAEREAGHPPTCLLTVRPMLTGTYHQLQIQIQALKFYPKLKWKKKKELIFLFVFFDSFELNWAFMTALAFEIWLHVASDAPDFRVDPLLSDWPADWQLPC